MEILELHLFSSVLETSKGNEQEQQTKVQYSCLMIWRILAILILPYFWWKGGKQGVSDWWNPKDPKLVLTNYGLAILVPLLDCVTDFRAGASYFKPQKDGSPKDPWFGRITISVPFLPFLLPSFPFLCVPFQIPHKQPSYQPPAWIICGYICNK